MNDRRRYLRLAAIGAGSAILGALGASLLNSRPPTSGGASHVVGHDALLDMGVRPPLRRWPGTGPVELIEFFSYGCPHCRDVEGPLQAWLSTKADQVAIRRMPVTFGRRDWELLAEVAMWIEALPSPALHRAVIAHLNRGGDTPRSSTEIPEFLVALGANPVQVARTDIPLQVMNSLVEASSVVQAYGVMSVPSFLVGGRYVPAAHAVNSHESALRTIGDAVRLLRSGALPA